MATKSEKILELYAQGLSTRAIAEIVGTSDSYVRVVARQRKGRSKSENDERYLESSLGQQTVRRISRDRYRRLKADPDALRRLREQQREYRRHRYHNDPEYRQSHIAKNAARLRERYWTDAEFRERVKAYQRNYRASRRAEASA